jgi:[calcium/calmodulin-dependent protein kinase] kinase
MKAIHKFKSLLAPKGVVVKSHEPIAISKLHIDSPKDDEPPLQTDTTATPERAQATAEHASQILSERERFFQEALKTRRTVTGNSTSGHEKGHAHPLSSADVPFLGIGTGGKDDFVLAADLTPPAAEDSSNVVSESPTAVDFNVYDRAFEAEVELIKRSTSRRKQGRAVYKTRHLKSADKFFKEGNDVTFVAEDGEQGDGGTGTRENKDEEETGTGEKFKMVAPRSGPNFADLVNHTVRNARKEGQKVASALVGGDDGDKAQAEGYGE